MYKIRNKAHFVLMAIALLSTTLANALELNRNIKNKVSVDEKIVDLHKTMLVNKLDIEVARDVGNENETTGFWEDHWGKIVGTAAVGLLSTVLYWKWPSVKTQAIVPLKNELGVRWLDFKLRISLWQRQIGVFLTPSPRMPQPSSVRHVQYEGKNIYPILNARIPTINPNAVAFTDVYEADEVEYGESNSANVLEVIPNYIKSPLDEQTLITHIYPTGRSVSNDANDLNNEGLLGLKTRLTRIVNRLESIKEKGFFKLRILVPYNPMGNHWVGLVIDVDTQTKKVTQITYIDSMQYAEDLYKKHKITIHKLLETKADDVQIDIVHLGMQTDRISCCVLVIENLIDFVTKPAGELRRIEFTAENIKDLIKTHDALLKAADAPKPHSDAIVKQPGNSIVEFGQNGQLSIRDLNSGQEITISQENIEKILAYIQEQKIGGASQVKLVSQLNPNNWAVLVVQLNYPSAVNSMNSIVPSQKYTLNDLLNEATIQVRLFNVDPRSDNSLVLKEAKDLISIK